MIPSLLERSNHCRTTKGEPRGWEDNFLGFVEIKWFLAVPFCYFLPSHYVLIYTKSVWEVRLQINYNICQNTIKVTQLMTLSLFAPTRAIRTASSRHPGKRTDITDPFKVTKIQFLLRYKEIDSCHVSSLQGYVNIKIVSIIRVA